MKKLSSSLLAAAALALVTTFGGDASAQKKAAAPAKPSGATHTCPNGKVVPINELCEILIAARPTRPSAVVELGKVLPEIDLQKIRQPFISKIEEALSKEPF